MTELQKRVRILIEQSEYEKATEVFLFETGAKVSINYKGYFINPLWNEDTPRPKYSVRVSRGRSHFFITFWLAYKNTLVMTMRISVMIMALIFMMILRAVIISSHAKYGKRV